MYASITRTLPPMLPASSRPRPRVFTMTTPASVSAAPVTRRAVSRSPRSARARTTFDTWPKFTRRPATAAVVSRTPKLKSRKSTPRAKPANADQPSRGSQRVRAPPSTRKQSAAAVNRVAPTSWGEKLARVAFVATGPRPQHTAAAVPSATPSSVERGASEAGWTGSRRARPIARRSTPTREHVAVSVGKARLGSGLFGVALARRRNPHKGQRPDAGRLLLEVRLLRPLRPRGARRRLRLQLPRPTDPVDPRGAHPGRPGRERRRARLSLRHRVRGLLCPIRHSARPARRRVGPPQADRARSRGVERDDGALGAGAQLSRARHGPDRGRHR